MRPTLNTDFLKTTIISGIFFLIPIAVVIIILSKLLEIMRQVAQTLNPGLPLDTPLGQILLNFVVVLGLLVVAFVLGLLAQSPIIKSVLTSLESTLVALVPGYSFVKGFANNLQRSNEYAASFIPVVVQFDDYSQIAFEIERDSSSDKVALYLPGAPNPWSGSVVYVTADRVRMAPANLKETLRTIRALGIGSVEIVARERSQRDIRKPEE
ncbi:MAG TPA: DUF502 domain-containing protein [Leptolyngbyaceae cyanobacterium M65_K2018_010]|nr:DUF502 domain-containing protein [Leptolyngbyaceae cyanobacterium M65_K2018_010]